jgi:hypothetical protein
VQLAQKGELERLRHALVVLKKVCRAATMVEWKQMRQGMEQSLKCSLESRLARLQEEHEFIKVGAACCRAPQRCLAAQPLEPPPAHPALSQPQGPGRPQPGCQSAARAGAPQHRRAPPLPSPPALQDALGSVRLQSQPQVDAAIALLYSQMGDEVGTYEEALRARGATGAARRKLADMQALNGERRGRLGAAQARGAELQVGARHGALPAPAALRLPVWRWCRPGVAPTAPQPLTLPGACSQAKQRELAAQRQQLAERVEQLGSAAGAPATPGRGSQVAGDLDDASHELDILTNVLVSAPPDVAAVPPPPPPASARPATPLPRLLRWGGGVKTGGGGKGGAATACRANTCHPPPGCRALRCAADPPAASRSPSRGASAARWRWTPRRAQPAAASRWRRRARRRRASSATSWPMPVSGAAAPAACPAALARCGPGPTTCAASPPPLAPAAASRLLAPFTVPRAQLRARLEELSVAAGRLAGLLLGRLDTLVLAWRQLAAVAFDGESGCLLLEFVDVRLGARLQVQVGAAGAPPPAAPPPAGPAALRCACPAPRSSTSANLCLPLRRRCSCSTCCPP